MYGGQVTVSASRGAFLSIFLYKTNKELIMNNCEHKQVLTIYSHGKDMQSFAVPHLNIEYDGYAPDIEGVCCGDDVNLDLCLDCGVVVNFVPMTDKQIKGVFDEEGDYDDEEGDEDEEDKDDDIPNNFKNYVSTDPFVRFRGA